MHVVLIVEDDADVRAALSARLEEGGYEVRAVGDAQQALDHLLRAAGGPAALVVDIGLPGTMNGWEFIAVIQSYIRFARLPVFVISGAATPEDAPERAVVSGFFSKPLDMGGIVGRIDDVTGVRHTVA